ncbi:hypothetical protein [Streptomyces sp. NPDC051183]|uniref:hypothetical protein n=1 Tax=Streptomyces sp. NPDC051183 TaxID=3155165 RepID=UPI00344271B7
MSIAMLGWVAAGCGSPPSETTSPSRGAASASATPSDARTQTLTPTPTIPPTTNPATDVLLAEQITILAAGNGAVPDCTADLGKIPGIGGGSPAVWIGNIRALDRVITPDEVALCLSGFSPDAPVDVVVTAGGRQYATTARPAASELTYAHDEPSESLFTGQALAVHPQGDGVLQSEKWWFVPPDAAREDLAAAGTLTIRATQGTLAARHSHPVELPDSPDRLVVDSGSHRILIYGFEPGARIPVGLYRTDSPTEAGDRASLVRQIGTVVMPRSRSVVFTVPEDIVREAAGQGSYCVTVPMPEQYNCPQP